MTFAQWLVKNWVAILAVLQSLESLLPTPAPVPGPLKAAHSSLGVEMQTAAAAAGIDWSKLSNFVALVEKYLPVLIALFGQTPAPAA